MTMQNRKPLTLTFPAHWGEVIRDYAQAQHCTDLSAACACVQAMMSNGGPTVLEPYGVPMAVESISVIEQEAMNEPK